MKNLVKSIASSALFLVIIFVAFGCQAQDNTVPKSGKVEVPAKGSITLWEGKHSGFSVELTNQSTKNSCELYKVKGLSKKWVSPSLLPQKSIDLSIAKNGSLFIENYSDEKLVLTVNVK